MTPLKAVYYFKSPVLPRRSTGQRPTGLHDFESARYLFPEYRLGTSNLRRTPYTIHTHVKYFIIFSAAMQGLIRKNQKNLVSARVMPPAPLQASAWRLNPLDHKQYLSGQLSGSLYFRPCLPFIWSQGRNTYHVVCGLEPV